MELTCVGRGPVIRAEAYADDKYAALDVAYGRLEERLRRAASRRHARHKKSGVLAMTPEEAAAALEVGSVAVAVEEPPGDADVVYEDGPVVVRDKTHPSEPMSVPDALHAMELVGHDFFSSTTSTAGTPPSCTSAAATTTGCCGSGRRLTLRRSLRRRTGTGRIAS